MIRQTVFAFLCALGVLLLVWLAVGIFLLPVRKNTVTVWLLDGDEREVERELRLWRWLRGTGLLSGRLLLLDSRTEDAEFLHKLTEDNQYIDYVNILRKYTEETSWNESR